MFRRVLLCVAIVLAGVGVNVAPAFAADYAVLIFSKRPGAGSDDP
ncbi:hypothetical protein AB0M46_04525 [Dactylosporangium sp. NPDC051485]